MDEAISPKILLVDDTAANLRILDAVLTPRGYHIVTATNGQEAMEIVKDEHPDLILCDIVMPLMDGYEFCRHLREDPATRLLPVIMITASEETEKVKAIEAGADDFIVTPFSQPELLARVKSLLRVKEYQDQIQDQATELADLNRTLKDRVAQQVEELERLSRLRRFLSPQLAQIVINSGAEALLESHRANIAVVFADLRGFTSFSETAEPEELMDVLSEYHQALGTQIHLYEGTVGFFSGDGLMVIFNDPLPCPDPASRAVSMALGMRTMMGPIIQSWRKHEHELGFASGIALGYATLGLVGFEGRYDYTAIGPVVNLAARLCAEAKNDQIIITRHVLSEVEELVEAEYLGHLDLKGFQRPIAGYNVQRIKTTAS